MKKTQKTQKTKKTKKTPRPAPTGHAPTRVATAVVGEASEMSEVSVGRTVYERSSLWVIRKRFPGRPWRMRDYVLVAC